VNPESAIRRIIHFTAAADAELRLTGSLQLERVVAEVLGGPAS
jgi:hypothetical protein